MSPSLLSRRLTELQRAGLVTTRKSRRSSAREYVLTKAGWELEPVMMSLAVWGHRWARDMTEEDLDPAFLLWSMHRRMDTAKMPPGWAQRIKLLGPRRLRDQFPDWLLLSELAGNPRLRPGRERRLARRSGGATAA